MTRGTVVVNSGITKNYSINASIVAVIFTLPTSSPALSAHQGRKEMEIVHTRECRAEHLMCTKKVCEVCACVRLTGTTGTCRIDRLIVVHILRVCKCHTLSM